jgi:hypothetical protein
LGLVEKTSDVEFDETNNSQEEQENLDDVGNERIADCYEVYDLVLSSLRVKMMMIHHLYFRFCHLPLIEVINIKLVM